MAIDAPHDQNGIDRDEQCPLELLQVSSNLLKRQVEIVTGFLAPRHAGVQELSHFSKFLSSRRMSAVRRGYAVKACVRFVQDLHNIVARVILFNLDQKRPDRGLRRDSDRGAQLHLIVLTHNIDSFFCYAGLVKGAS